MVAAAVVALIAAIPALSAAGAPNLAPLTPAQVVVKVQQAKPVDLWGTIDLKTSLGIPNLGALGGAIGGNPDSRGFDPTSLLSGSHQALVWFAQPDKARLALLGDMSEVDVVHNGTDTWTWDSVTKKVVHYTKSPEAAGSGTGAAESPETTNPAQPVKTPQQLADDLLAHLDPSTVVSTAATTTVANQDVYQLVLTPRAPRSTVDHVIIAVDNVTGLALRVQIFAKGQQTAALDLGFGDLHYATPAASNFRFTPPPGATVTNKTLGGHGAAPQGPDQGSTGAPDSSANHPVTVGQDWTAVEIFPQAQIPAQYNEFLKAATPVSGAFGSGRLVSSQLVNVLLLDDGRVAVGAVTPAALEAAVAGAP